MAIFPDTLEDLVADDQTSFIDVKIPLQCLVKDSSITVNTTFKVSSKFASNIHLSHDFSLQYELPGFFDPAIGEDKVLRVQFKYRDITDTVVIDEKDEIMLPLTK